MHFNCFSYETVKYYMYEDDLMSIWLILRESSLSYFSLIQIYVCSNLFLSNTSLLGSMKNEKLSIFFHWIWQFYLEKQIIEQTL